MRELLSLALLCLGMGAMRAQPVAMDAGWATELEAYWAKIEAQFRDPAKSPLPEADRATFQGLERFAPDERYLLKARFKARVGKDFAMPTTTERRPTYRSMGRLVFKLDGRRMQLTVYQNIDLVKDPAHADHLFVPFTDLTNGESTYGGGRYLDLKGPLGKHVVLDLNRAYNPYCAYGGRYSCPIPPAENHLVVRVEAGVKAPAE
jgi:uncharacterized protein (DUF1684 family)